MIKVSVIVPVYKVSLEFLRECFDSLLAQTMKECEFIVVSDGAPDAECSVCEEYAKRDPRFKFFRREHAGVSATRNFGIGQAQGEYITFVDSDDWIDKDTCQLVYKAACESKTDIILWECAETNINKKVTNRLSYNTNNKEDILSHIFVRSNSSAALSQLTVCKLYKNSFLKNNNILFNEKLPIEEDTVFNFQALEKGSATVLHRTLYYWRKHNDSSCHKYREDIWAILHKAMLCYKEIAPTYNQQISNATLIAFYECWGKCYFNKKNTKSVKEKVNDVISLWQSKDLQDLLLDLDLKKISRFYQVETWFLQHNIFLPLWLHAIKNRFI